MQSLVSAEIGFCLLSFVRSACRRYHPGASPGIRYTILVFPQSRMFCSNRLGHHYDAPNSPQSKLCNCWNCRPIGTWKNTAPVHIPTCPARTATGAGFIQEFHSFFKELRDAKENSKPGKQTHTNTT